MNKQEHPTTICETQANELTASIVSMFNITIEEEAELKEKQKSENYQKIDNQIEEHQENLEKRSFLFKVSKILDMTKKIKEELAIQENSEEELKYIVESLISKMNAKHPDIF